jgi:hypothetical protein
VIVTDKFVFVHLPRSGGTFVSEMIKKFFPSAKEIGHHMPRELLPKEHSHLPVFGTVRNPWEFYVSLYHYVRSRNAGKTFISWMTENGTLGFDGSVRNMLNIGVDQGRLDLLIETLPDYIDYSRTQIPNVTKHTMRRVRGTGVAYYTFRFNQLFGNPDDMVICQLETLRRDLIEFFEQIGAATDELRDYVLSSEKKNQAAHLHYSAYYTPELANLVSIRDRQIVERFGYTFEQLPPEERAQQTS